MCNSAGIIEFDDNFLDMVRSGIMTYGLYPSEEVDKSKLELHPALELKSHIAYIKSVGPGFTVSYGSTFTSKNNMRIATGDPVGYGDGVSESTVKQRQGFDSRQIRRYHRQSLYGSIYGRCHGYSRSKAG